MDISKSVFSLAKYNNGFFKSEKQAAFLTKILERDCGLISSQYPFIAEWDEKGITKITKKDGEIHFERKVDGKISAKEEQEIKNLEKAIRKIERELKKRWKDYNNGAYHKPDGTISQVTYDLFHGRNQSWQDKIDEYKAKIKAIEEQ